MLTRSGQLYAQCSGLNWIEVVLELTIVVLCSQSIKNAVLSRVVDETCVSR